MPEKSNVLIVGYGEMGHAMEYLLADRHQLTFWDKYSGSSAAEVDLLQAASLAEFVILCIPVNPHREILKQLAASLSSQCICISIAKGIDENGQTASQILHDVLDQKCAHSLLYGPMISEEIRRGRHAFAQLACSSDLVLQRVQDLFKDSRLHIRPALDINGANWAVILKNVYAIIFGVADELQLGDNVRGYLAVESLIELNAIVMHMGGREGTVYQLAGLGDLITTATSAGSHHHELGRKLARGEQNHIDGEGVHTLEMINKHDLFNCEHYPLFNLIKRIVRDPAQTVSAVNQYLDHV